MPDGTEVRVKGYDELAQGSATLAKRIGEAAPDAFQRVADDVAGLVQAGVPVRTGALAGTVASERVGEGASVGMGDGIAYAHFVEFGGRGHPYAPQGNYLVPAAQAAEPMIVAAGEDAAQSEIGDMRWPSPT